jgi:type I restriction enzyme, S subunit
MSVESAIYPYPESWELLTLGELCNRGGGDIQTGPFGSQLHAADYVDEGIPSIMPKNISVDGISTEDIARIKKEDAGRLSKYLVTKGDIIYSRRGDVEKCALISQKESGWLCGTGCLRVRLGKTEVNSEYIHAYLSHPQIREWIVRNAVGATMPNLNTSILNSVPILIPPNNERKIIEDSWVSITDKININRQINKTLEQISQAIFKSWFIDFEPVKAKIAAIAAQKSPQDINRAAMSVINGKTEAELDIMQREDCGRYDELREISELFPSAMQESELGEIPQGWEHVRLETLIDLVYGKALRKPDRTEGSIPVYGSGGITGTHNQSLVEGPGVIIGRKGTVGSLYWENNAFYPIDTVFYVNPKEKMTLEFAYYLLKTLGLNEMNTDAAVPGLNRNNVYRLEVPKIPDALIARFTHLIQSMRSQIKIHETQTNILENIRDILLPKLLSGEIQLTINDNDG